MQGLTLEVVLDLPALRPAGDRVARSAGSDCGQPWLHAGELFGGMPAFGQFNRAPFPRQSPPHVDLERFDVCEQGLP